MLKSIKSHLLNLPGWHTNRKIVVIESDDWGSIRMPSKKAFENLVSKGYDLVNCPYNRFDALETNEDVELLADALHQVKDCKGNPAKMTLNNCVANPNFEQIRSDRFNQYTYEPFTTTYEKYPNSDRVLEFYKRGLKEEVFQIQFHGREHLNVSRWMKALQRGDKPVNDAFDEGVFSPKIAKRTGYTMEYMDALDYDSEVEANEKKEIISDGLQLFREVWGFNPKSFIAPCYRWDKRIEEVLKQDGVEYIQGQTAQLNPKIEIGYKQQKIYHYTGQKNRQQQVYLVRNVHFEPSTDPNRDWVDSALSQIEIAFRIQKPAIICSHRLNYVGRHEILNRESNLQLLTTLLKSIKHKFPNVEFMSSDQLGDLINKN
jgi:predicted deacetylase